MGRRKKRFYTYKEIMAGNYPKLPPEEKLMLLTGSWTRAEMEIKLLDLFDRAINGEEENDGNQIRS